VRVAHFSIQTNHLHLIIESTDAKALADGMRGLGVRLARAVNRVLGRRGPLAVDRYHAHPLRTPREVRHAIVYVLANARKHGTLTSGLDPLSSARWFDGYAAPAAPIDANPPPTHPPRTWLLRVGWQRHGLIDPDETPAA
jgi:hypothetical protein